MKKIIIMVLLCLISFSGCKNNISDNQKDVSSLTGYTSIEKNVISEEEALYLLQSEYDGIGLEDGEAYKFTYKSTEQINGRNYLVFKREVVAEDGTVVRLLEDSWVSEDGSYVTDKNSLTFNQSEDESTILDDSADIDINEESEN